MKPEELTGCHQTLPSLGTRLGTHELHLLDDCTFLNIDCLTVSQPQTMTPNMVID